jgi:hypothetical protein
VFSFRSFSSCITSTIFLRHIIHEIAAMRYLNPALGAFQFGGKFCRDSLQRRETEPASVQIQSP